MLASSESDHHQAAEEEKEEVNNNSAGAAQYSSSSSPTITLKFVDVSYIVKLHGGGKSNMRGDASALPSDVERPPPERTTIISAITGSAAPGRILAVLGPSGSGKSTLLNILAGRLQHGHGMDGSVLYNDEKLSKHVLRRTGFVAQDDVMYPHLTVRETLVFCSLLRLPESIPRDEKIAVAEQVMSELGLSTCENTMIGSGLVRGVSGGERKRVSIAHEMLVNPTLLVLDEPTSGLDATAAYRLVVALGGVAAKGKTVVISVHQPSSRVHRLFDDLLVLSEGRSIYFGKRTEAMAYFESVGFTPGFPMNPADFLIDLANGICQLDGSTETENPNIRQALVSSYTTILEPTLKAACMDHASNTLTNTNHSNHHKTTWLNQFTILLQRSLKERKHESFNRLRVLQVIAASLLAGTIWWRSDSSHVQDRLGLLFFFTIYWGVLPSFNAVFAFPQERGIFVKETTSGMYTLSSYFLARMSADLPVELVLPTLFVSVTYWMSGLKPEPLAFMLTLAVILAYVLVSIGLGLAIGALIMDVKQSSTVVTTVMLAFVLLGGYYVHKVPTFIVWMKYVSTTFYTYKLLIDVQYGDGEGISSVLDCSSGGRSVDEEICSRMSPVISVGVLLLMFFGYRLVAYVALRQVRG